MAVLEYAKKLGVPRHLLARWAPAGIQADISSYVAEICGKNIDWCFFDKSDFCNIIPNAAVWLEVGNIAVETFREQLPLMKRYNKLFKGANRGITFGAGTCSHPFFLPSFLQKLYEAANNRSSPGYAALSLPSAIQGMSYGNFLILLFSHLVLTRLR